MFFSFHQRIRKGAVEKWSRTIRSTGLRFGFQAFTRVPVEMNKMLVFFKKKLLLKKLNRTEGVKSLLTTVLTLLSLYSSFILDQTSVKLLIAIRFVLELLLCLKAIKFPKHYRDYVFGFAVTSFIVILFTFEFAVVTKLKILLLENTVLMLMICCSIAFLTLSCEKKRRPEEPILIDYLYENTLKPSASKKSSLLSLNLALSLLFATASLIYTSNLILTSVCYPKYYFRKSVLLPNDCSFVYTDNR